MIEPESRTPIKSGGRVIVRRKDIRFRHQKSAQRLNRKHAIYGHTLANKITWFQKQLPHLLSAGQIETQLQSSVQSVSALFSDKHTLFLVHKFLKPMIGGRLRCCASTTCLRAQEARNCCIATCARLSPDTEDDTENGASINSSNSNIVKL